nr:TPA_asm: hypothetical protein HUJ06_004282 [Nelumbo nucifera]
MNLNWAPLDASEPEYKSEDRNRWRRHFIRVASIFHQGSESNDDNRNYETPLALIEEYRRNSEDKHHASESNGDASEKTPLLLMEKHRENFKDEDGNHPELFASIKQKLCLTSVDSSIYAASAIIIYRIPKVLHEINKKVYVPQTVAIGPFHYSRSSLQGIEEFKQLYLKALFHRTANWEIAMHECIVLLKKEEETARKCYSEPIKLLTNEFVTMMLVDGCFVLELFYRYYEKMQQQKQQQHPSTTTNDDDQDPMFKQNWMLPKILYDMLLLENQLPFFILELLFQKTIACISEVSLEKLVHNFFENILPTGTWIQDIDSFEGKHILHLLRQFMCRPSGLKNIETTREPKLTYSVTELREAGVKFKKKENANSFLDITFTNGILEIPNLVVQGYTECLFRNLIAFEQCYHFCTSRITSYAFFMDSLINIPEDVQYLNKKGIITNVMSSHEEVSVLFNNIRKGAFIHNFYYADLCRQVNEHFENRWNVWRAIFRRKHFQNPFTVVSLIAAALLLLLTFTGTLFAMLSYFIHKS